MSRVDIKNTKIDVSEGKNINIGVIKESEPSSSEKKNRDRQEHISAGNSEALGDASEVVKDSKSIVQILVSNKLFTIVVLSLAVLILILSA